MCPTDQRMSYCPEFAFPILVSSFERVYVQYQAQCMLARRRQILCVFASKHTVMCVFERTSVQVRACTSFSMDANDCARACIYARDRMKVCQRENSRWKATCCIHRCSNFTVPMTAPKSAHQRLPSTLALNPALVLPKNGFLLPPPVGHRTRHMHR